MKFEKKHLLITALCITGITFSILFLFKEPVLTFLEKLPFNNDKEISRDVVRLTNPNATEHIVLLTEQGFEPNTLIIRRGDQVIFKTQRGVPFWPASNNHPEHGIYAEFDPLGRVAPEGQWIFKFDRLGSFVYHDHVSANDTGVIIVLDEDTQTGEDSNTIQYAETTNVTECRKYPEQSVKQQCWDQQLEMVLDEKGIEAAFDFFVELYQTDPEVPKECHGWGHTLGEEGYRLYKEGTQVSLRPEAAYCGYGYFHGFIGGLMQDTGDMTKTKEFCEYVVRELQDELKSIKDNCVHGVGHGTTAMLIEQPDYWGNYKKTVTRALEVCEMIYDEHFDLINCYDGVFNEASLDLFQSNYGLNFDEFMEMANNDPFYYCQRHEDRHKESCYFEFTGIFWTIFDGDVVKSTQFALDNTEKLEERGAKVIAKIAADQIQYDIVKDDHSRSIEACDMVPDFLHYECFKGILNGFIQHGDPLKLHIKGYKFCDELKPDEDKVSNCYEIFTDMFQWTYTDKQIEDACIYAEKIREVKTCDKYL